MTDGLGQLSSLGGRILLVLPKRGKGRGWEDAEYAEKGGGPELCLFFVLLNCVRPIFARNFRGQWTLGRIPLHHINTHDRLRELIGTYISYALFYIHKLNRKSINIDGYFYSEYYIYIVRNDIYLSYNHNTWGRIKENYYVFWWQ